MKAKIYNDNPHVEVWKETFKGIPIEIKRGEPLEMEFFEAHEFKGQFYPPRILADETQDPASFKMIRIEKLDMEAIHKEVESKTGYSCNACKKSYPSLKILTQHSEIEHGDIVVSDESLEDEIKKEVARKKPGPKSKQASISE